ncbi:MAG: family 78 glycoside hydrolase catalytic domain [Chthoniobacterales bacterium]
MKTWKPQQARWIWLAGDDKPDNAYVIFRRRFDIGRMPAQALAHVTADCRYRLSVNGAIVGQGPVTTDPKYKQVDVYDIAAHLRPGENVIAVLVLQRHAPTSRLWPARGGFLLEFASEELRFGTDAVWKARWADEYKRDTPYMTHQYGHQEWCDGRKAPDGWDRPGFDDRAWQDAIVVEDAAEHWPAALELRAVPLIQREIVHPKALVCYFGLSTWCHSVDADPVEPAWNIMLAYPLSSVAGWNTDNIVHPENGPAVFCEKQGDGLGFVVDLGTECYGHPFIDLECPAGTIVDIGHGEVLSRNRLQTVLMPKSAAEQLYADRYIAREGRQHFEIFDTKGCRYLEIHCNRVADFHTGARVVVHEVGIVNRRSPMTAISDFRCSDERLNRIWAICRHTAEVKCQDWHICDAQREQNNWPEIFQDMLYWQCFGRVEMVRQMIHQFCRAQLADGFFLSTLPIIGKKPMAAFTRDDLYVFSTMIFPLLVYLDWLYGGEDERQVYWLDCCAKAYDEILKYAGSHGTLANLPGTQWVEWTGLDARDPGRGVKDAWEMPVWNAMAVLVLGKMAEMADGLAQPQRAADWRRQAAAIRTAADARYWSEARQAYPDGIYDGAVSPSVSQATNAVATLAGLGGEARLRAAMTTALDPKRCDVASGMNMMALFHEALESLGMDGDVLDHIRRKWGYMLDHGATTTWESEEALERHQGLCFGFGGHPLNYLARTALGVVPLDPGYRRFSVRLVPHDLKQASGQIVTPYGLIGVEWQRAATAMTLKLTVPSGCEAVVGAPRLEDGATYEHIQIDGTPAALSPRSVAVCTFLRETLPAACVRGGTHQVVFQ